MSILAFVTRSDEAPAIIAWAAEIAKARGTNLSVLCWARSLEAERAANPGDSRRVDALASIAREIVSESDGALNASDVEVRCILSPDAIASAVRLAKQERPDLLVAAAKSYTGEASGSQTDPLLRNSPCSTLVLINGKLPATKNRRVLLNTVDGPHDMAGLSLAMDLGQASDAKVSLTRTEESDDEEIAAVGKRELKDLLRDAGISPSERIHCHVYGPQQIADHASEAGRQDMLIVGANNPGWVERLLEAAPESTIGVIKRTPALQRGRFRDWVPQLSPADYADLVQMMRRGSRSSPDYVVMVCLAAAIATLGLLQNSPAVVIGSMILAPLMNPIISAGLALAQGNAKLGRNSAKTILLGFVLTLSISWLVGIVTPGREMTSEVLARGNPNILDLLIALSSAAAGAYAFGRPSVAAGIAGVAIATALVPPLCALGISLSYREYLNAQGAALLFVTNVVAIILAAAGTFRLLGVRFSESGKGQRKWAFPTVAILGVILIGLAAPLSVELDRMIARGRVQPNTYPLTEGLTDALTEFIENSKEADGTTRDVEFIVGGRPSSQYEEADVVLVISSPRDLPTNYADELIAIVRREMNDEDLRVEVHCLRAAWRRSWFD